MSRAKPYWVRAAGPRGGKFTLSELIDKYDDLISKKVAAVTLPEVVKKEYKKIGYEETRGGKILVPHAATETVHVKKGQIVFDDISGISRVQIPCKYHDLPQWLECLRKHEDEMNAKLPPGRLFAFRYWGGHSMTFEGFEQLLDHLEEDGSGSLQAIQSINTMSSRDMNELYRNLEIVTVRKGAWEKSKNVAAQKKKAERKQKSKRGFRRKLLEKLEAGPKWKLDRYHAKRAAAARQYRLKLTGAKKEEYKKAALKRARKSNKRNRP